MKLTRQNLIKAAKELNNLLSLDPKIRIRVGIKNEEIINDILEACELIEENDEISPFSEEIINCIKEQNIEAAKEDVENMSSGKEESEKVIETDVESIKNNEDRNNIVNGRIVAMGGYKRARSVAEVIKSMKENEKFTREEIREKANNIYVQMGGKSSKGEPKFLGSLLGILVMFNVIEEIFDDEKLKYRIIKWE